MSKIRYTLEIYTQEIRKGDVKVRKMINVIKKSAACTLACVMLLSTTVMAAQPQTESVAKAQSVAQEQSVNVADNAVNDNAVADNAVADNEAAGDVANERLDLINISEDQAKDIDDDYTLVEQFVIRLYQNILDREADFDGLELWSDMLTEGKITAAEVVSQFINSKEFVAKSLTAQQLVEILYRTLLGRASDEAGLTEWSTVYQNGMSRNFIASQFVGSEEFAGICESYGVMQGEIALTENRDKDYNVTAFVNRMYKLVLSRNGEADGLNSWTGWLLDGTLNGSQVVAVFFDSTEYTDKGYSSLDTVKLMYETMMNRKADDKGANLWATILALGISKDYVINEFGTSAEFKDICSKSNLTAGSIKVTDSINMNLVYRVCESYQAALGYYGLPEEVAKFFRMVNNGETTFLQMQYDLVFSQGVITQELSTEEFVTRIYNVCLGRNPDPSGLADYTSQINHGGMLRTQCFRNVIGSQEAIARYAQITSEIGFATGTISDVSYGIDVSQYQGDINWQAVRDSGIEFAIIRIGYGNNEQDENGNWKQDDTKAVYNMTECERLGIPYGVYLYSYAVSMDDVQSEIDHTLRMIDGFNPELGVFYDVEDPAYMLKHGLNPYENTQLVCDFCYVYLDTIRSHGYNVGLYTYVNFFMNVLKEDNVKGFAFWVAQYADECTYDGNYIMWQYTSQGTVPGIKGNVDMNIKF